MVEPLENVAEPGGDRLRRVVRTAAVGRRGVGVEPGEQPGRLGQVGRQQRLARERAKGLVGQHGKRPGQAGAQRGRQQRRAVREGVDDAGVLQQHLLQLDSRIAAAGDVDSRPRRSRGHAGRQQQPPRQRVQLVVERVAHPVPHDREEQLIAAELQLDAGRDEPVAAVEGLEQRRLDAREPAGREHSALEQVGVGEQPVPGRREREDVAALGPQP